MDDIKIICLTKESWDEFYKVIKKTDPTTQSFMRDIVKLIIKYKVDNAFEWEKP